MTIKNSKLKVLFFGTPDFAVASLEALIATEVEVAAVITATDKPAGRGRQIQSSAVKVFAEQHDLPILQPENLSDETFLEELKNFHADLFIVVAFRMLPKAVWNMPPHGTINIHASLLPKYRGAAPIHWAIINGEQETGVTSFQLREKIDTGPILLQKKIPIHWEDTLESMYHKLMKLGAELLIETVDAIMSDNINPIIQNLEEPTLSAPKIHKETGAIDWTQKGIDIYNLVRGLFPFPGAFTAFNQETMKIFKVTCSEAPDNEMVPGHFESDRKTYLKFKAQDSWIHILEAQLPGKKRMEIKDLLRGYRWPQNPE